MAQQRKIIITCAVTGGIHTPTMSPHLPITAKEIEEAAVGAIGSRTPGREQRCPSASRSLHSRRALATDSDAR
jgi:hypothetical protein